MVDGDVTLAWATLEAPLVQLGNIHLPYAPFPATIPPEEARPATVYSWAMNNLWDTNFPPAQGGEVELRYAVGGADPPLHAVLSSPRATGDLPERGQLARLPEGVELLAIGAGGTALVHSRATEPVELAAATVADHLGRPRDTTTILPGELLTVTLA
jgi:hypothetical protein